MKKSIILLLTVLTSVIYASGFALPEQGSKAISMGNAFSAVADDASALFYNPAGITQLDGKINFNLGASLLMAKSTWEHNSDSAETEDAYPVSPQFNFTYKIMPKLVIGLGFSAPFAAKIEWPDGWAGSDIVEMMNVQLVDVSPTIAYEVMKGLSIALTYDLGIGAVELRKRVKLSQSDYMLIQMASDGQTFAHGFKASLFYQWNALRTGLVFKYGKTYNFEGKADFDVTNAVFNSSKPSDQNMTVDLTLPNEIIWGISYEVLPKQLLLSFELQYTMWSSYEELRFKFEKEEFTDENGNPTNESVSEKDWENVFALRFGMEYRIKPEIALRAGYTYDFNPVPDETLDPSLPDSDRHIIALGMGYAINDSINIDMAYSYVLFTERTSTNHEFLGTYNTDVNIFSLTAGFKF